VTGRVRRSRVRACWAVSCVVGLLTACGRSNGRIPKSSAAPQPASTDVFIPVSPTAGSTGLAEFQPDLPAVDGPFECTGREPIGESAIGRQLLGPDAVSFSAVFPSRAEVRATIVVDVDSTGKLIRYAERRGPPIRPSVPADLESSATPAQVAAAAAAVRSTVITLDFRRAQGSIANRGGGRPDQIARGPIEVIGSMEKFGKPLDRAARILAQCRVK
jgi:hypothetical protein